jgi:thioredoxin reductase (NADPH)
MARPVILVIDDDAEVRRAVERDLRRKYNKDYRLVSADSAATALETLEQLALRGETVALLLSDQRMPDVSGVEFLEQALRIFPKAKRTLLTAYADTDAAIRAINSVKIDYYLLKPWDPPEEKLYPILDDLLDDWWQSYRPPFEGLRVVGTRWSPEGHQIKDFLARNLVPYQWLDLERDAEARRLLEFAGADPTCLPLVLFPDGSGLSKPSTAEIATQIGLRTRAEQPFYDMVIVGGGPAGLAAAVYGASEGLSTVLVEREAPGGQAGTSSRIENYLGFPQGISGGELARRAVTQARKFEAEVISQEVVNLRCEGPYRVVTLGDGSEIRGYAVLIATGVSYRTLDVAGVERLTGAGIYYGAAQTEAMSCRDETVFVVGGANSAGQAAMYFAKYAGKVVMLVRAESLAKSMSQYLINQIEATPNIEVRSYCQVVEAHGQGKLEALTIRYQHGEQPPTDQTEPASGLFIFIGAAPRTDWLAGIVERDAHGFILAGADLLAEGKRPRFWPLDRDPYLLETSVPGIFVAGDVRAGSVKRVASGVGEGSIAIQFVHRYLESLR